MRAKDWMAVSLLEDEADLPVNEYEGAVLGMIARTEPVTRYQLLKAFRESPTTTYNTSKGSFYPLVGRLVGRGFVAASPGKRPGSELFTLTPLGHRALTQWVSATGPQHSMVHDPLLLRVMSLTDLSRDDRLQWVASAKSILLDRKNELNGHRSASNGPYADIVHGTALAIVEAKLEWLDRLLILIVNEAQPPQR
jgi:DNA-binding PadR family transcriptional regulator